MRKFYIFNINKEFRNETKIDSYVLFKVFEEIYNMNKDEINYGINIYNNIIIPINKNLLSNKIYDKYKYDENYIKFMNTHLYNNYFDNEYSKLIINNSYIEIDSSSIKPSFFNFLNKYKYLFVCDFENKDYFWLESIA